MPARLPPHPRSESEDELGSLPVADQTGNRLCHCEHELLQLLVAHHIFLLHQLPHGGRQKLQRWHQELEG